MEVEESFNIGEIVWQVLGDAGPGVDRERLFGEPARWREAVATAEFPEADQLVAWLSLAPHISAGASFLMGLHPSPPSSFLGGLIERVLSAPEQGPGAWVVAQHLVSIGCVAEVSGSARDASPLLDRFMSSSHTPAAIVGAAVGTARLSRALPESAWAEVLGLTEGAALNASDDYLYWLGGNMTALAWELRRFLGRFDPPAWISRAEQALPRCSGLVDRLPWLIGLRMLFEDVFPLTAESVDLDRLDGLSHRVLALYARFPFKTADEEQRGLAARGSL